MAHTWATFSAGLENGTAVNIEAAEIFESVAIAIRTCPLEYAEFVLAALASDPNGPALLQRHIKSYERILEALKQLRTAMVCHPASRVSSEI